MEEAQLDILSRQCDTLIALCHVAREKQRAILSGAIDDLLELAAQEERLAESLQQNEEERAGFPGGSLTLQEMEEQYPGSRLLEKRPGDGPAVPRTARDQQGQRTAVGDGLGLCGLLLEGPHGGWGREEDLQRRRAKGRSLARYQGLMDGEGSCAQHFWTGDWTTGHHGSAHGPRCDQSQYRQCQYPGLQQAAGGLVGYYPGTPCLPSSGAWARASWGRA